MKQSIFFIILVISFLGCQDINKPEKPKNLIGKDKMVDILTETYLANAARSVNNRAIIDKGIRMDSVIYKKFGIDSIQFVKSNAFYAADVNNYMELVQKVEAKLTVMQQKMDSISEMEKDRKDSISKTLNERKKDNEADNDSLI